MDVPEGSVPRTSRGVLRRSRRWCVPPAVLQPPGETLEGAHVLAEIPDDLGVLLWRTLRDVTLWADTPAEARANLFTADSAVRRLERIAAVEIPAPIAAYVDTINGLFTVAGGADAEMLTICCLEVATWARREGLVQTAVAFAQAGALASPQFSEAALHTGIAASAAGQEPRAETWLRRAVGVARRAREFATYAAALVELAELHARRGEMDRAEHGYRWAYRAARRARERRTRLRAAHGLFRLARTRGDDPAAADFAAAALRAYRRDTEGGPDVLLDLARFWIDRGAMDQARAALRRLAPARAHLSIGNRLLYGALVARAFAETDVGYSAAAATEVWRLVLDDALREDVRLTAALDIAHAARTVGDLVAFTRAKRAILRLAPKESFPHLSAAVAKLWPEGQPAPLPQVGRAS